MNTRKRRILRGSTRLINKKKDTGCLSGGSSSHNKFAVMAIFKNEAAAIREWIEHYKWQGVDTILLLNNNSTDNWKEKIKGLEENVTVLDAREDGAQVKNYTNIGLPWLKAHGVKVLTILDLDEFMYGTGGKNLKQRVEEIFGDANNRPSRVTYLWTPFGSSGHNTQPNSIRKGFTWKVRNSRSYLKNRNTLDGSIKSIIWLDDLKDGDIDHHKPQMKGKELGIDESPPGIKINHYRVQSKQFWRNVKMKRGDVYHKNTTNVRAKSAKRNWEKFKDGDVNELEDTELKNLVEKHERETS